MAQRPAVELLDAALRSLDVAITAMNPAQRYAAAHLAALRACAAVLSLTARPAARRPTSAWLLLATVAPEYAEWAAYFSAGAGKRALAQAGIDGAVSEREADDLIRDAGAFIELVAMRVDIARQMPLPASS
jgi:hypothetical protein